MIIALQIVCLVLAVFSLLFSAGEDDPKHKPMYLTGSVAFAALVVLVELLLK